MLLAGLALGALAGAGTGLLVFLADDRQLRDITFWMLGSLAGATWQKIAVIVPVLALLLVLFPLVGRGLDLLALGETEAFHTGVSVERLKRLLIERRADERGDDADRQLRQNGAAAGRRRQQQPMSGPDDKPQQMWNDDADESDHAAHRHRCARRRRGEHHRNRLRFQK